MSLFDFFFPEQVQASHLRGLRRGQRYRARRARRQRSTLDARIASLEGDLGYVGLVLGALLHAIDEKGVVTRKELRAMLEEIDEIDGVKDGKLDIDILRGMGR